MKEYKIHGITVYSNDELQSNLEGIIISHMPPHLKPIFLKLIKSDQIVPFVISKNMIQKLLNKIKRHRLSDVLGTANKQHIFILLSDNMSKPHLIETLIHEAVHYAALKNYNSFFKLNLKIFYEFYSHFYKEYLKSNKFDKELFNKFIISLSKQDKTFSLEFNNYRNIENAFKDYTSLDIKKFEFRLTVMLKYMDQDFDFKRVNGQYPEIVSLIKKTYRKMFGGFDDRTYVGQELYYPSEIISVLSTINEKHDNIKKTLQILR
jgi:hypothetical protein